ncbi:MAG TPA: LPP20 family lipoprotein [Geobacterales bacterium]|nr:LPP20 family lipoprotein [Geobacterales bacterium]
MRIAAASLVLLTLMLSACSHTPPVAPPPAKPAWVDGSSPRYPERLYLTAVGLGQNRRGAEDAARADLAKALRVKVTATTFDQMRSELSAGGSEEFSQRIESLSTTATDQTLEGVSIAENYEDPQRGLFYALAILDRDRAANLLRDRINALDAEIVPLMERQQAPPSFTTLRDAVRAADAIQRRQVLNAELIILGSTGSGIPSRYSIADAQKAIDTILAQVPIGLEVTGDDNGEIRTALIAGLTDARLTVLTDASKAPFVIRGNVTLEKIDVASSPWQWYSSTLLGELIDREKGTFVGALSISSREGAQDSARGRRLTLRSLSERAAAAVKRELVKKAGSN